MQHVYAIGPMDGPFKIGIAGDVAKRLSALQTGFPSSIKVHFAALSRDARRDESTLHGALASKRLSGEWFDVTLPDLADAFRNAGLEIGDSPMRPSFDGISAGAFTAWTEEMRKPPFNNNDIGCAQALGVTLEAIRLMKREGADKRTALACRALLHRLEPYA